MSNAVNRVVAAMPIQIAAVCLSNFMATMYRNRLADCISAPVSV